MAKTIIVSNRLPVSIERKDGKLSYKTSAGGLATGLGSVYKQSNNLWIGWPGVNIEDEQERQQVKEDLKKENMVPLFLTEEDIQLFYEGFSNSTLWPLFHYFARYAVFEEELWQAYVKVNQKFCDLVIQNADPEDTIWIHDYQLLLLPEMVRNFLHKAAIGFFNHIPFPSYEIFRIIPWRSKILRGMLGADLVGFHTYDDVRHFLSAVSRIIGIDNKMGMLRAENHLCHADSFPMGIDFEKFDTASR